MKLPAAAAAATVGPATDGRVAVDANLSRGGSLGGTLCGDSDNGASPCGSAAGGIGGGRTGRVAGGVVPVGKAAPLDATRDEAGV